MNLTGKVVVVTGATSGLGQAAAIAFAKDGARVFVVGRDAARAEETRALCGGNAEVVVGDVSTRAGSAAVAAAINEKTDGIDALLNNAGGTFKSQSTTADGTEATLALNAVAPWMLATRLRPALARRKGRVVNVATGFLDRFPLVAAQLNKPTKYSGFDQYGRAKLAAVMMTVEQAAAANDGVTFVSVHPGVIVTTRFGGGLPPVVAAVMGPVLRLFGIGCTLDEAVRRFRVACFDDVKSGSYMQKGVVTPLPKQANDAGVRQEVVALLNSLTPA